MSFTNAVIEGHSYPSMDTFVLRVGLRLWFSLYAFRLFEKSFLVKDFSPSCSSKYQHKIP